MKNGEVKMVQGVREVFEITSLESSPRQAALAHGKCKIVLIGRDMRDLPWKKSLIQYLECEQ